MVDDATKVQTTDHSFYRVGYSFGDLFVLQKNQLDQVPTAKSEVVSHFDALGFRSQVFNRTEFSVYASSIDFSLRSILPASIGFMLQNSNTCVYLNVNNKIGKSGKTERLKISTDVDSVVGFIESYFNRQYFRLSLNVAVNGENLIGHYWLGFYWTESQDNQNWDELELSLTR